MDFTIDTTELFGAVRAVSEVAPSSSPIRALRCIYLESDADTGALTLYANSYAAAIACTLKAKIEMPGKILIDAKFFLRLLERLCRDKFRQLRICEHRGNILLTSGVCQFLVPQLSEGFPKPSFEMPEQTMAISSKQIVDLVGKCGFAAASDQTANERLKSVFLTIEQNNLTMTASDGQVLARAMGQTDSNYSASALVPAAQLRQFAAIAQHYDMFRVGVTERSIIFARSNMLVSITRMPGQYMDTGAMLDMPISYKAEVDAVSLRNLMESAAIGSLGKAFRLGISTDSFIVEGTSADNRVQGSIPASNAIPSCGAIYALPAGPLTALRNMRGTITVSLTKKGHLFIRCDDMVFFQVASHAPVIQRKPKETPAKPEAAKKQKTSKPKSKKKKEVAA